MFHKSQETWKRISKSQGKCSINNGITTNKGNNMDITTNQKMLQYHSKQENIPQITVKKKMLQTSQLHITE